MPFQPDMLKAIPLFRDLDAEQSAELLARSQYQHIPRGENIYFHGDPISHFHVICQGIVQTFRETPSGHEITSEILIAGDCLNPASIIAARDNYLFNARAVEDARLLLVPIRWMRDHVGQLKGVLTKLAVRMSETLQHSQMEAEQRLAMSSTQIVACYLQELCVLYNFDPSGFELPYSKTLIASRLHIELETFSRALKGLRIHGVRVEGTHVSFTDLGALKGFVCDTCTVAEDCLPRAVLLRFPRKTLT